MKFIPLKSGLSVEKRTIEAFKTEQNANQYLYLMAGVHGDEIEGMYLLEQLFSWLKTDEAPAIPTVVIPVLNVDGKAAKSRVNANGVDLNRNLATPCWEAQARSDKYYPGKSPMSEPENVYLGELFKRYPPFFIVSLHSWKRFINVNSNCMEQAKILQSHNNYPIIDGEIEDHPTPGSLGEYGPLNYSAPVITFECPQIALEKISLEDVWAENEAAFKTLIKHLSQSL